MNRDWGVPNWRDATAYPAKLTMLEWWWEFTRRRPDYREAWDAAQVVVRREHRLAHDVDELRLRFELSLVHDPARSLTNWELMQYRYPRNFLRSPVEPLLEAADHPYAGQLFSEAAQRQHMAEDSWQRLYNFDLSRPLGPQLKHARQHLISLQMELFGKVPTRRPRHEKWRDYLRAIDARDHGATLIQIANGLWPGLGTGNAQKAEKARDTYDAAAQLRDNFPL